MNKVFFGLVVVLSMVSLANAKNENRKPANSKFECEDKALTVAKFLQSIESREIAVKMEIARKTPAQGEGGVEEYDVVFYTMGKGNKLEINSVPYRVSTFPDGGCTVTGISRPGAG